MPFTDPERNLSNLHLGPGMKVADFGAGSGFYAIPLADRVGGTGRVFAIDVQKELLAKIRNESRKRGYHNVEVVWGDLDKLGGTKLANMSVDTVLVSNVLFQSESQITLLREAKRVLKPGGEMLLIDWTKFIPETKARELVESVGFKIEHSFNAGDHHYGLLCKNI
jgi:ubiquinone/menaquinone biosynthesis C-methylase UbiE